MKLLVPFIFISVILSGCNQATTGGNLQPSPGTNDAAIANLNLGIAYMEQRDYEKALEKLEKARQADPRFSTTYNMLGLLYQTLGDNSQAEGHFKKGISLNPNDSSTLNNYGRFLCQTDRFEEAEEIFLRSSNNPLYDTPEIAITNAGTCAMMNDRQEDAEMYFRQALQHNPKMPEALIQMATISYKQVNYLSARAYLQRYQEQARHTPKSLWLGIRVERELGDSDALASYSLLLKNGFPDSRETGLLLESETQ